MNLSRIVSAVVSVLAIACTVSSADYGHDPNANPADLADMLGKTCCTGTSLANGNTETICFDAENPDDPIPQAMALWTEEFVVCDPSTIVCGGVDVTFDYEDAPDVLVTGTVDVFKPKPIDANWGSDWVMYTCWEEWWYGPYVELKAHYGTVSALDTSFLFDEYAQYSRLHMSKYGSLPCTPGGVHPVNAEDCEVICHVAPLIPIPPDDP